MMLSQSESQPSVLASTLNVLMGKWDLIVCFALLDNEFRMADIVHMVELLSARKLYTSSLNPTIKKLIRMGIVDKRLRKDDIPYYTTYSLTEKGEALRPVLTNFVEWGQRWSS